MGPSGGALPTTAHNLRKSVQCNSAVDSSCGRHHHIAKRTQCPSQATRGSELLGLNSRPPAEIGSSRVASTSHKHHGEQRAPITAKAPTRVSAAARDTSSDSTPSSGVASMSQLMAIIRCMDTKFPRHEAGAMSPPTLPPKPLVKPLATPAITTNAGKEPKQPVSTTSKATAMNANAMAPLRALPNLSSMAPVTGDISTSIKKQSEANLPTSACDMFRSCPSKMMNMSRARRRMFSSPRNSNDMSKGHQ
mmetsp:Transcript_97349/g.280892  ORF Transcript_97349/g.280892 Transcript_97349/m.280892 type:complete len:249 (+) Transcript_97349:114-860(+)